eukprot:m.51062 g.51062  ORF g.51062 m.51062 type:complete len:222 (+) comp48223_c0_seq2:1177-1842(+)
MYAVALRTSPGEGQDLSAQLDELKAANQRVSTLLAEAESEIDQAHEQATQTALHQFEAELTRITRVRDQALAAAQAEHDHSLFQTRRVYSSVLDQQETALGALSAIVRQKTQELERMLAHRSLHEFSVEDVLVVCARQRIDVHPDTVRTNAIDGRRLAAIKQPVLFRTFLGCESFGDCVHLAACVTMLQIERCPRLAELEPPRSHSAAQLSPGAFCKWQTG